MCPTKSRKRGVAQQDKREQNLYLRCNKLFASSFVFYSVRNWEME